QKLHQRTAILLRGVDDLHQRRPAPRLHAEEAAAECRAVLSRERSRIAVAEAKRARHRPVARFRRHVEHKRVGGIERDGTQQFHSSGPPVFGSSHVGFASACASWIGAAFSPPIRCTTRSPLASMRRLVCACRSSRPRYWCARLANPSICQRSKATIKCRAKPSVTSTAPASPNPSSCKAEASG